LFDKQQQGRISSTDLETIMGSLNRDANEVREFIENIDPNQNSISFNEFIQLMQNVENRIV
jgi:Ca2+-binding EF-hand superfamily protein